MDHIVIPVSSLISLVKELETDKMEYVSLSMLEPEEFDGDIIPASLLVSGFKSSTPNFHTDYETIEHIPDFD